MKKLNLKLGSIKEMLTKEQMKKIIGGGGYDGTCISNYFYSGPLGCGVTSCYGYEDGNCKCTTVVNIPQPCGFA